MDALDVKRNPWPLVGLALLVGFGVGRGCAPSAGAIPPVSTLRRALDDPDWLSRTRRMSAFLEHLSPENLPAALEIIEPELPWLATDALRIFMLAWSRFDPEGALAQALAWPPPWNRNAAGAAMYAWAFREPEAAVAALEATDAGELHDLMEGRLVAGWAHSGRVREMDAYLTSLPRGPRRFKYIGMLAWELSKRGPGAVQGWAEDAPAAFPDYKAAVFLKATTTLAAADPAGTARWLEPHLARSYADGIMRVLTRSWATHDPRAAMQWLASRPAGVRRDTGVSNSFRVWYDRAPDEAMAWLASATPSLVYDAALSALIGQTLVDSARDAMEWALRIADDALREQILTNVGRRWLRGNRPAAEAWLSSGTLPPDLVDSIRLAAEAPRTPGAKSP
jgi:hypothetical protein